MNRSVSISDLALRWAPLCCVVVLLVAHALRYRFVTDDAYISFVYSRNLIEHGQLVFNPGLPPVEGYTNFLWTAVLALLMAVGLPPEVTSQVLGIGFGAGVIAVAFRLTERLLGERSGWDLVAPALLALSAGFACWSSGGLETQMFTFWVALAIDAVAASELEPARFRRVGVWLALAAMTRPEGLLVAAVVGGHRLVRNAVGRRRLRLDRHEWAAVALFLLLWAPWFAWRWWYYGHPFPNTYYAKASGATSARYVAELRAAGRYYVWQWATQSRALYAAPLAAIGWLLAPVRSARFVTGTLAVSLLAIYLVYTVLVGGDFMGLHRFVMPLFFVVAVGTAIGLAVVVRQIRNERWRFFVAVAASLALVGVFALDQRALTTRSLARRDADHGIDTPGYLAQYAHDRAVIGKHMAPCFLPTDFSIFGGVGAKPYYAHARGIDVFGLVSERVAHEMPPSRPRPGHNKWGSDPLLAEHDPTFVFSCYSLHREPLRPAWRCNPQFWLRRGYEAVTLHIPGIVEGGEYYTFLVKKDRNFTCAGKLDSRR